MPNFRVCIDLYQYGFDRDWVALYVLFPFCAINNVASFQFTYLVHNYYVCSLKCLNLLSYYIGYYIYI